MKNTVIHIISALIILVPLNGCHRRVIMNNYSLEKINDSELPVCVNRPKRLRQKKYPFVALDSCKNHISIHGLYEETGDVCDILPEEVVDYSYCLAELPKPPHLVQKHDSDMVICYDRHNKVKLPIEYCQKDMSVFLKVNTSVNTSVSNTTKIFM